MRLHQPGVFRLAYLLLGDGDDAEDVTQETFIRAYRAIHLFDPTRDMRPWLLSIAANLARNRRRSLARLWSALQRWVFTRPAALQSTSIEDLAGDRLRAQRLWQAVQCLRKSDQEILYLRHFLDLSETEVSQIQNIAIGTVKSRTHRALAKLRRVIETEFPDLGERSV